MKVVRQDRMKFYHNCLVKYSDSNSFMGITDKGRAGCGESSGGFDPTQGSNISFTFELFHVLHVFSCFSSDYLLRYSKFLRHLQIAQMFSGNRQSLSILLPNLTPYTVGQVRRSMLSQDFIIFVNLFIRKFKQEKESRFFVKIWRY